MKFTFAATAEAAREIKMKEKTQDWTDVAAAGLKKATLRAKENPLHNPIFPDPAFT